MSNRTKQVQFRMPEELHTELKAALVYDKSSFADFFNKAAEDYLKNRKEKESEAYNHLVEGSLMLDTNFGNL